jgi:hypothetical protein
MRKILMAAAATVAIATPAFAETTGALGVRVTNNEYDAGFEYDVLEIEGSIFHRIAGPWAVQGEGRYEDVEYPLVDDEGSHFALHGLFAAENWTAGVLVGQGEVFDGFEIDIYGAEGAIRFGDWTLSGAAVQGDIGVDYARYQAGLKYFFGDNFAIGGRAASSEFDGGGSGEWTTFDAGIEWRFASFPVTLTGGYLLQDTDFSDIDALTIGARWEFGSATLRESDRTAPIADLRNYFGDLRRWD